MILVLWFCGRRNRIIDAGLVRGDRQVQSMTLQPWTLIHPRARLCNLHISRVEQIAWRISIFLRLICEVTFWFLVRIFYRPPVAWTYIQCIKDSLLISSIRLSNKSFMYIKTEEKKKKRTATINRVHAFLRCILTTLSCINYLHN